MTPSPPVASPSPSPSPSSSPNKNTTTLRSIAKTLCKSIDIGTALHPDPLFGPLPSTTATPPPPTTIPDELYPQTIISEFNSIVIEHHLKWTPLCHTQPGPISPTQPSSRPGRYDFYHVDRLVDWALSHSLKIKGHVLCWHVTTPPYVNDLSPHDLRNELKRHIYTTVGHFRGRIKMWDVVNEALAPDGTLAKNIFLEKLGEGYIADCFKWAHDADPTAFLIYNDNKVEGMYGCQARKAEGFYQLLKRLIDDGVPVHGAGMQAHFNAGGVGRQRIPTPRSIKAQIRRLGELGLKVNISEMDVRISRLPADPPRLRSVAQRQIYHDVVAAAISEPACDGIWLWGFTDKHTWVKHFYYEDEPLIFDECYERKESYFGLKDALLTLAPGGVVGGGVMMEEDVDDMGRKWGYEWMQKEEEDVRGGVEGDSRPDWQQS